MKPLRPRHPPILGFHFSVTVWLNASVGRKARAAKVEERADRYGLAGVDRRLLTPRFTTLIYTGSRWLNTSSGGLRYDVFGRATEDVTVHAIAPGLTRGGLVFPLGYLFQPEFLAEKNERSKTNVSLNFQDYVPSFADGRLLFPATEAWDPTAEASIEVPGEVLGGLDLWRALEQVWRWTISEDARPGYREALPWAPGFESSLMSGREQLTSSDMTMTFDLEAIEAG